MRQNKILAALYGVMSVGAIGVAALQCHPVTIGLWGLVAAVWAASATMQMVQR